MQLMIEFDKLQRGLLKADSIIKQEGVPRFYIRTFCDLEDHVNSAAQDKDSIKKMNSSTSKAFNTMKQKIKKEQKLKEKDIEKFRAVGSFGNSRILWTNWTLPTKLMNWPSKEPLPRPHLPRK